MKTKLVVLTTLILIGLALMLWGNHIMMNYDGFREVWKEARSAALPQFLSGILVFVGAYVLTYTKTK